ncbi:MAG: hypothetical protein ACRCTE_11435 [Cellulosilyticaceae bacterium]
MQNLLKLIVLMVVAVSSWQWASTEINERVIAANSRQKTIADVVIQKQVQETFKEVEEKIEVVMKEENIVIETQKVEMKPPAPPKPKEEKQPEQVVEQEQEVVEVVTEEEVPLEEIPTPPTIPEEYQLSKEDVRYVGEYLVQHYFLYGYDFLESTEDEVLNARKALAYEMENAIVESLTHALRLVRDMKQINEETVSQLHQEVQQTHTAFEAAYQGVGEIYEDFGPIYEEMVSYFECYKQTLQKMQQMYTDMKVSPNPGLAMGVMMKQLTSDILPGMMAVLGEGFELKERTNAVYLEGITDRPTITKEEAMAIILDPKTILPQFEENLD